MSTKERLLTILCSPHVSEKTAINTEQKNEYAFRVISSATKTEVKDAIEMLFETKVKNVRVLNVKPKTKTFRGKKGSRKGWKKAYVTLLPDQTLDVIGAQ